MSSVHHSPSAELLALAEHATELLREDERVRLLWFTGSLATGTADGQSDLDLRIAVCEEDFATVEWWWQPLIEQISATIWK